MNINDFITAVNLSNNEAVLTIVFDGNEYSATAEEFRAALLDVQVSSDLFWDEVKRLTVLSLDKKLCGWCEPLLSATVGAAPSMLSYHLSASRRAI